MTSELPPMTLAGNRSHMTPNQALDLNRHTRPQRTCDEQTFKHKNGVDSSKMHQTHH